MATDSKDKDTDETPAKGKSKIIKILLIPLLIVALGGGGYVAFKAMTTPSPHQANLEKFGFDLTGSSPYTESEGILGETQLPASFASDELSPAEKVVYSLVQNREKLIVENRTLRQRIEALEQQLVTYEEERKLAEHFLPERFNDELKRVEDMLLIYLKQSSDAQRFNNFRLEIMAAAGRVEYRRFVESNMLILDANQRSELVIDFLPAYMFCIGDAVDLAANNFTEEREIRDYFGNPNQVRLSLPVQEDLEVLLPPCQLELRQTLQQHFDNIKDIIKF